MKYVKPYKLFEKTADLNDDEFKTLIDIGLMTNVEKAKAQKYKYTKWKITLQFDWTWASQHTSEEAKPIFFEWLTELAESTEDKIVDPASIEIDDWVQEDFWEENEEEPDEPEPNYGHSVFTNFIVYVESSVDQKSIYAWADNIFVGGLFESVESVEKEGEE